MEVNGDLEKTENVGRKPGGVFGKGRERLSTGFLTVLRSLGERGLLEGDVGPRYRISGGRNHSMSASCKFNIVLLALFYR